MCFLKASVLSKRQDEDSGIVTSMDYETELLLSFNRGGDFSSHYYEDHRGSLLHSGDFVSHYGVYFGRIVDVHPLKGVVFVSSEIESLQINVGDTVAVRDGNNDIITFPVGKLDHPTPADQFAKWGLYGAHPDQLRLVKPSYSLYLVARKRAVSMDLASCLPVSFQLIYHQGDSEIIVSVRSESDHTIALRKDFSVDLAYSGGALSIDRIRSQMSKTGGTSFRVTEVDFSGDLPIAPVSLLNHIRRTMLQSFETLYVASFKRHKSNTRVNTSDFLCAPKNLLSGSDVTNGHMCSYKIAVEYINLHSINDGITDIEPSTMFYVFSAFDILSGDTYKRIDDFFKNHPGYSFAIRLNSSSRFLQDRDMRIEMNTKTRSHGDQFLGYITDAPTTDGTSYIISHHANITNIASLSVILDKQPDAIEFSHEVDNSSLEKLLNYHLDHSGIPVLIQVYGPIEWMLSHFCPVGKNAPSCKACANGTNTFHVTKNQRQEEEMARLILRPMSCTSELYGKSKYDRSVLVRNFSQRGLNVLRLIRIIDESEHQIFRILSDMSADV